MKYICVTGGVISGIGKGIVASSLGAILKAMELRVTSIKIDPYLNIDAGTFSPYEHGEVFVLDDGGEVDLDLGNYERFMNVTLCRDHNITTGKIYQSVIHRERKGEYLGKTVQVVPHITTAIQDWIIRVAQIPVDESDTPPDVCVIELGGTVGDIESMPFIESLRQFQFRVEKDNFMLVHVSLVPQPSSTGEQKSKPTQHSVRELRGLGLTPNVVVCRAKNPVSKELRGKISMFCHVKPNNVLSVHDVNSTYRVPLLLEQQGMIGILREVLKLNIAEGIRTEDGTDARLDTWKQLADRYENLRKTVRIVLVGKYTGLQDSYASVIKALKHSALRANHQLDLLYIEASDLEQKTLVEDPVKYHEAWQRLCSATGVLIPGGFGSRGIEGKIIATQWAREKKIPFFGVCLGLQIAVIEFARNVLGWEGANSTEVDPETKHPVVIDMPEISTTQLGGTMRLGKRRTNFVKPDSITQKMYRGADSVFERHRHRYEVNPELVEELESSGLSFVGQDDDRKRMEIVELPGHPFFVGVQYHPEFKSRPLEPSPPFLGFVLAACGKLDSYLAHGHRASPIVGADA